MEVKYYMAIVLIVVRVHRIVGSRSLYDLWRHSRDGMWVVPRTPTILINKTATFQP